MHNLSHKESLKIIDDAEEKTLLLDAETNRFVYANQKSLDFFTESLEQICEFGVHDLGIDVSPETIKHAIEEALRGGNPVMDSTYEKDNQQAIPCTLRFLRCPPYARKLVKIILTAQNKDQVLLKKYKKELNYQASLLDQVSDVIISTDAEFRIRSWNQAAQALYGWAEDDVIGLPLRDLILIRYSGNISREAAIAEYTKKGEWQGEILVHNKAGEQLHILATVKACQDEHGILDGGIAIHRNITQQKQVEIALKASEEKFSKAFEHNSNVMILADVETMTVLDINRAYSELTGYTREEVLNIPGKFGFSAVNQDTVVSIRQELLKEGHIINREIALQRKDGTIIHGLLFLEPLDIQGKQVHICTYIDITERKLAEEQLLSIQQELYTLTERLQLANEVFQVGIWDWDLIQDTFVWDETMYKLYGIRKDEVHITHDSWQRFMHPEDLPEVLQTLEEALQDKDKIQSEARIIWPDASIHHIRTNVIIQRNTSGQVIRMIGTNRDVTAEKEAEQQKIHARLLEVKNKELEYFTYMASHDLKEPLRTIIGFTSLLQKRHREKLPEIEKEYLDYISKAAYRMDSLIKALLDYSKIGINQEQTIVDLHLMTHYIMDDLSIQISESQAIIKVEDLPKINGFETELRVLFQNLISNAIKFRKDDTIPQIHISAQQKEKYWELCFADNGIGIESQYWDRIFTVFQRLHASDRYEGTGIGLAHCRKIAELHGGSIWITSEVGQGSSFFVRLPALN